VLIPILLIFLAVCSAGAMAYGTHPDLAHYAHGLTTIMLARRLQWPLAAAAIILCIALIALVIAGKRRAWWLIGLAPVLALFVHGFTAGPGAQFGVYEDPAFVEAKQVNFLAGDHYVVGLQFGDNWYAYPYATLYRYPVVAQADHEKRMLLMWSPQANRASAITITRDIKPREIDIVSMPASALLLYNRRIGQFINALTARTPDGAQPFGFQQPIATTKTTWKAWASAHPNTKVLVDLTGGAPASPAAPLLPRQPMPPIVSDVPPDQEIALVATTQPAAAVVPDELGSKPINLNAGDTPVFVFRDPDGVARAFDRHVDIDLMPQFRTARGEGRKGAAFIDNYTETAWSLAGVAMDGEHKGKKLTPVPIEEGLTWGVMKYWYPKLELHHATTRPSR
jgi:hypothetical protein